MRLLATAVAPAALHASAFLSAADAPAVGDLRVVQARAFVAAEGRRASR
jgi:hypothetical protein